MPTLFPPQVIRGPLGRMHSTIMNRLRLFLLIFSASIVLQIQTGFAQTQHWYVNPGIKLGYAFGSSGGFVLGGEVSLTTINENHYFAWGILASVESVGDIKLIHCGVEYFPHIFYGASFGPSFVINQNRDELAWTTTVFGGAFILPYYRLTIRPNNDDIHEIGSFFKLLIPLQRESL